VNAIPKKKATKANSRKHLQFAFVALYSMVKFYRSVLQEQDQACQYKKNLIIELNNNV